MIVADPEILVVDDSATDRLLMGTVFERAGFAPALRFACDGEEAIAYLRGDGGFADRRLHPLPAVMLLDLNMPRKDGFEVLAWVRQDRALRRLRIYVLSASSQPEDIRRCYDLGANAYLVKPRNLDGLMHMARTLHAWLGLTHLAPAGEPGEDVEAAPISPLTRLDPAPGSVPMEATGRKHRNPGPAGEVNGGAVAHLARRHDEHQAELLAIQAEWEARARVLRHDLGGPVMSIGGFADLLAQHSDAHLDEKGRQYLAAIGAAAEKVTRVLSEAAAFSRLEREGRGERIAGAAAGGAVPANQSPASIEFVPAVD